MLIVIYFVINARYNLWVTLFTYYQTLIQLITYVNSWKFVKRTIKQSHYSCKEPMVEIIFTLNISHYYKIENGTIFLMLVNNVIMHIKIINNFTCYMCMIVTSEIKQIVTMGGSEKPRISFCEGGFVSIL